MLPHTHSETCAKAHDHSKACNCPVRARYDVCACTHDRQMHLDVTDTLAQSCTMIGCSCDSFTFDSRNPFNMGKPKPASAVDHPAHYGGADNPYEAIRVIEAWQLDFCLGNCVKYISRAGKKDPAKEIEDLEKSLWYLRRAIEARKAARE